MTYFGNLYRISIYECQLDPYSISFELGFSSLVDPDPELPPLYNKQVSFLFLGSCLFKKKLVSCRVFPTATDLACGFSIPHPSYGPSDLTLFPPPFPISHNDPIITIYPFTCAFCSDHYKIP
jgi:hypothetical protein